MVTVRRFCLWFYLALSFPLSTIADRAKEIHALISFKQALDDPLGVLTGWDPTSLSAPCDWQGVICSGNGSVHLLRLSRLHLSGSLSPALSQLQELRTLSLPFNRFVGSVPYELASLPNLRALLLQSNSFSGPLPAHISNFSSLQILNLSKNKLSGDISSIVLPAKLRFLDLSFNGFSSQIPDNLSAAPNLQFLDLSSNSLHGPLPANLGEVQKLQYIRLEWNQLEGIISSSIANCSSLEHLGLQGNEFRGPFPEAIESLPGLRVLTLSHNHLSGPIPVSLLFKTSSGSASLLEVVQLAFNEFTQLSSPEQPLFTSAVQILDIGQNAIRGKLPNWLVNLPALRILDLSSNWIKGQLQLNFSHLSSLQELRLGRNFFYGELPAEVVKCSLLRVLDVEHNQFSGPLPFALGQLTGLTQLKLGSNLFSGEIPLSYTKLSGLQVLSLGSNALNGNIPHEVTLLHNLTTMDLSSNRLAGQIPDGIGSLQELRYLNLSSNRLSGEVPGQIGSLLNLRTLDLSKQNFSGKPPLELSALPNLQYLSLEENSFSGHVPEGISSLSQLRYLNLASNSFTSQIPATYGYLKFLAEFSLSHNKISGTIPADLANCSSLERLHLQSNQLRGVIPIDFSKLYRLRELDLSNNTLSGRIAPEIFNSSSLVALRLNNNHLSGAIPNSLTELPKLRVLDLSSNNLAGQIPQNLSLLPTIKLFNVSRNDLEGEIPPMLGTRFNDPLTYAENPNLCGKPLNKTCRGIKRGGLKGKSKLIILLTVVSIMGTISILCCCCFVASLWRWKKDRQGGKKRRSPARGSSGTTSRSGENGNGGPKLVMFTSRITFAEALEATRQFDEENVLSRGRYGLVFKASFQDGTVLSIRRLPDCSVEESTFFREAELLGKVKHRNLTVLRGYYTGPPPDVRLLVYDYMPNGNLATLLQEASHQDGHVLNWPMRHLIALGVARGIAFLHTVAMIHGDIKPQTILFDADFEAHLSDFGLEKLAMATPAEASTSTPVGTLGYMPPEVVLGGEATKEADVYSFGIVLLELLTGKRPVMFAGEDEDIVKWVKRQLHRGQITELLEPGLLELDPESSEWEEFLLGVKVGLLCTAPDPLDRPSMADVVFMLEGCRVGPELPSADPTCQPSPS